MHLVQRGHNRGDCFFGTRNYVDYLQYLARFAARFRCSIHAYCLMTNHVHLLLTPHERDACARMMKQLNQCYAQGINHRSGRSGSLWSGRFRSCLVTTPAYVLTCYRYIEFNPVRAGMVEHPREYPWCSYRANAEGASDPVISPHPAFMAEEYRQVCDLALEQPALEAIRQATSGGYALGAERRRRGRPGKQGTSPLTGTRA